MTQHLNSVDDTGCIKFTAKQEKDLQMPFLDTLIMRKPDGNVKLLVYRKTTHTDQYLPFSSHHQLQHKLSAIRTLLDRNRNIVTEETESKKSTISTQHSHDAGIQTGPSKESKDKWKQLNRKRSIRKQPHSFQR